MERPGQSERESVFHPLMVIACYSKEEDEACREELKNAGYVWCTGASADMDYYSCWDKFSPWLRYFAICDEAYKANERLPPRVFFCRTEKDIYDDDMQGYEPPVAFADLFRKPQVVGIKIEDML